MKNLNKIWFLKYPYIIKIIMQILKIDNDMIEKSYRYTKERI